MLCLIKIKDIFVSNIVLISALLWGSSLWNADGNWERCIVLVTLLVGPRLPIGLGRLAMGINIGGADRTWAGGSWYLLAIRHSKSFQAISSSDLHSCLHLRDIFCKGRKLMETSLKRSCLGALYLVNAEAIQTICKFKVAKAREMIFEFAENTWAVYSMGTIKINQ